MNRKYDAPLSNFAINFDCNLRHYIEDCLTVEPDEPEPEDDVVASTLTLPAVCEVGGALQLHPGFTQITLHVLSKLET